MSQQSGGLLCPACRVDLAMSERNGVEIDYCPKCRGVWLDRGELDKILERGAAEFGGQAGGGSMQDGHRSDRPRARHDSDEYPAYGHPKHGTHRKRRSFLDDLFD
jgi:uncharacterized protein